MIIKVNLSKIKNRIKQKKDLHYAGLFNVKGFKLNE